MPLPGQQQKVLESSLTGGGSARFARREAGSSEYRLRNTGEPLGQLARNPNGILLENALLDTTQPGGVPIPGFLQAPGDPGAYLVQARGPVGERFRALLKEAGASIVSYIPNNACLVRASEATAQELAAAPQTQAVLPYEPYYKLKSGLLDAALGQVALPDMSRLRVLVFADAREGTLAEMERMGLEVAGEQRSPFGPLVEVRPPPGGVAAGQTLLAALARLSGVQEIELARERLPANDLSRATTEVAVDSVTRSNYLGLTGMDVLVAINDSGVDATHPDLTNRVLGKSANSLVDTSGHGTHVAGVIAGDGTESGTVTHAAGSVMAGSNGQFRGKAPGTKIFSMVGGTDADAQQAAARTKALISNNSWTYGNNEYDLAAASYDAATRDALPEVPGSQPVLFVFAAGNAGGGNDDGTGGRPGSVESPATAKNVITVGALEQCRHLTNYVWASFTNGTVTGQSNQPWLELTAASNRVAGFSSRGNAGIGVEGNFGRFKPDLLAPGVFVVSARSRGWDPLAYYSATNPALVLSNVGNSLEVLSNLNEALGEPPGWYRYESGTSVAAAGVAGTLALAQEFFAQRLHRTNSPALFKALLINGARALGSTSDFCVTNSLNAQGWGRVSLPTTIPGALTNHGSATCGAMLMFDQDPTNALATGDSCTRFISVATNAQDFGSPLRVTLVWTDPPGNPVAGIKLVNDLDLVVTNLETGAVYFGNDIPAGSLWNAPWDPAQPPNRDVVNNVENVYLPPPLGADYSVTVVGRCVNVDAVSGQAGGVVQDYALVISSGDGEVTNALTVATGPLGLANGLRLTVITNAFGASQEDFGALLLHQRVGADAPLAGTNTVPLPAGNGVITLGTVNQWHFYVFTNTTGFTNAAFVTFLPAALATAGLNAGLEPDPSEADIDLYVCQDPGLTNLDASAIAGADLSLGRGGEEAVVYSNSSAGVVYYIGVKSECQQGADYGFLAVVSQLPFSVPDAYGNLALRGIPVPAPIPDATPQQPGTAYVVAVAPGPLPLHRVIVTNTVTHELISDLAGTLTHLDTAVVLNNHNPNLPSGGGTFIYDDSGQDDIPGAEPSDGPGTLSDFAGLPGDGLWLLTETDTVPGHVGTNDYLGLFLEAQPDLTVGVVATILPGASRQDYVAVPPTATNLTIAVSFLSGTGPLSVQVGPSNPADGPSQTSLLAASSSVALTLDKTLTPPLNAGLYVLSLTNQGPDAVTVSSVASLSLDPDWIVPVTYTSTNPVAILDDAVTFASLFVSNAARIVSVEAGVRINHPRISDLVLRLVSPGGTRVLLDENRGGSSIDGMGLDVLVTNLATVYAIGGAAPSTNVLVTGQNSGTLTLDCQFFGEPDEMRAYYGGELIFDSGMIGWTNEWKLSYGPVPDGTVTITMNEDGNPDTNTVWEYWATATQPGMVFATFTEDTNLTTTPIKFALPPFTNVAPVSGASVVSSGIFFLPEESLAKLSGESAQGQWQLEIDDTRAGANDPPPALLGWQLTFVFADSVPAPAPLAHHQAQTWTVGPGTVQCFSIDVPPWANFATNSLVGASGPVNLLFNQAQPPSGSVASGDVWLLAGATGGSVVLSATSGAPLLVPGQRCYLGVQNTNPVPVTFTCEVDFDVPVLANGVPLSAALAANSQPRYFAYDVSPQAAAVAFQLLGLSGNAGLFTDYGLPFPTAMPGGFDYGSANAATNSQLILVGTNSAPVSLGAGRWYLEVVNDDVIDLVFTILATEFDVVNTNVVITGLQLFGTALDITWLSSPGLYYFIAGATNGNGPNWTAVSRTIVATDVQTLFPLSLPSPFSYFVIQPGLPPATNLPPVSFTGISAAPSGFQLQWRASTNSQFQVQWSPTLGPPVWSTISTPITSLTGLFTFLDDGSQSGGLDSVRFYRLLQLP